MYLVAGATGTVGREIVRQLAEAGHRVRALTRNPQNAEFPPGVEVARGDLTDPESVAPALEGVVGLHLITFGGDAPLETGPRLVELARQAGVRRVSVLSGFYRSGVEDALDASDLAWTLVQPVEFMANALEWAPAFHEGVVPVWRNHPSSVVHEADIAAVAVAALTQDGHGGQTYVVTGPEALTAVDRIRILSEDVEIEFLNEEQERARLAAAGVDQEYIEFSIMLGTNTPEEAAWVTPTVQEVTGKPARTFAQWAAENREKFKAAN